MSEDFEVEDILENLNKKKKIKSKPKGNRGELQICKVLNARFADILIKNPKIGAFTRSVGSGNRWGQNVVLSEAAKQTFSGDISVPSHFKFVIESKNGYEDTDLFTALSGGEKQINDFIDQVLADAERCGRKPMIIWRKAYKPPIVFLKAGEVSETFDYQMKYRDWIIYSLDQILSFNDAFFFEIDQLNA